MWRQIFRPAIIYILLFNILLVLLSLAARSYIGGGGYVRLGFIGTALVLLSLVYSLRKRGLIHTGRQKFWLQSHVFFGTAGAFPALLHADLKLNSLVASLAFLLMEAVLFSGALAQFASPGTRNGDETVPAAPYWRMAHIVISLFFFVLVALHILAEYVYRGLYL